MTKPDGSEEQIQIYQKPGESEEQEIENFLNWLYA